LGSAVCKTAALNPSASSPCSYHKEKPRPIKWFWRTFGEALEFFHLVRSRDLAAWPQWFERAKHTALRGFASSLLRDQHAVEAALTLLSRCT
jgi:hypothetical protein